MEKIKLVCQQFCITGTINEIKPFGEGLINSLYRVTLKDSQAGVSRRKVKHLKFPSKYRQHFYFAANL